MTTPKKTASVISWSDGMVDLPKQAGRTKDIFEYYDGSWIGNADGSRKEPHGPGVMGYKNGNVYSGPFVFGRRHGVGRLEQDKGNWYYGGHYEDKFHGVGTVMSMTTEGSKRRKMMYVGEFQHNEKHGKGKQTEATYKVLDVVSTASVPRIDAKLGLGASTADTGDPPVESVSTPPQKMEEEEKTIYDGEWICGMMHGQGSLVWDKDNYYEGEWEMVHTHICI